MKQITTIGYAVLTPFGLLHNAKTESWYLRK